MYSTNSNRYIYYFYSLDAALTPEDINGSKKEGAKKRGRLPSNLNDSCSRQVIRDLSQLGTRTYTAPEVLAGIRNVIPNLDCSARRRQTRRKSSSVANAFPTMAWWLMPTA